MYEISPDHSWINYTLSDGSEIHTATQFRAEASDAEIEQYASAWLARAEAEIELAKMNALVQP